MVINTCNRLLYVYIVVCTCLSYVIRAWKRTVSIYVGKEKKTQVFISCKYKVVSLSRVDWQYPFLLPSSLINCSTPTRQPWLAQTRLGQLERCQNGTLWTITGQLKVTPREALKMESRVRTLQNNSRTLLEKTCRHHLKRKS